MPTRKSKMGVEYRAIRTKVNARTSVVPVSTVIRARRDAIPPFINLPDSQPPPMKPTSANKKGIQPTFPICRRDNPWASVKNLANQIT